MQFYQIKARDISEAWFRLLRLAIENGEFRPTLMGCCQGEDRIELDLVFIDIRYPATAPMVPTVPLGIPMPARDDDIAALEAAMLFDYALKPDEKYYGHYLKPHVDYAIAKYKEHGHNLDQMCLYTSNGTDLYLDDPWVLKVIDTKIDNNKLHLIAYMIGLDLWQGVVLFTNALQVLKKSMADEIGCGDGRLYIVGKTFVLWQHQYDVAKAVVQPSGKT